MITARSGGADYAVELTAGRHTLLADVSPEKGGADAGPTPHDLVEAGLASCVHMTVRMYAKRKQIPLRALTVTVESVRTAGEPAKYEIAVDLRGPLDEHQRRMLMHAANACPVKKALAQPAVIRVSEVPAEG